MQRTGLNRNTIDKYYTKKEVVKKCIELIKQHINFLEDDLIIEPSAGNGVFIEDIKTITKNYIFYDIEPENTEIIKQDFLGKEMEDLIQKYKNINVIGNPPFGRQSSLAIKFIKKCCNFAQSISFILPKSFKKASMQKYFSKNFHLICCIDLPENSFLIDNEECNVPCVFQIWEKSNILRTEETKQIPLKFKFVKKNETPDISFRRVGVNAGVFSKEINNKSFQSHYFIVFTNNKTLDENIEKLKDLHFDFNNTVGPKSISKSELCKELNKIL